MLSDDLTPHSEFGTPHSAATPYLRMVAEAVEATRICSPTTYSWFGRRSEQLPLHLRRALPAATGRNYLLSTLQDQLYKDFYCPGEARPATPIEKVAEPARGGTTWFVDLLSAANCGHGYLQQGWRVLDLGQDATLVGRRGLALLATAEECGLLDGALEIGAELALPFPKELPASSPGYYMAVGDAGPNDLSAGFLRLYWNVRSNGAAPLMRLLTTELNKAGVRFRFKTLHDPEAYRRCDAAVLYIEESAFDVVAPVIAEVYAGLRPSSFAPYIKSNVPALTLRLAPGLGLAEDTFGAESFGQRRCRILAEGIIRAHEQGRMRPSERLRTVINCFEENGVSLERPYLNQGLTSTEYQVPSAKYAVPSSRYQVLADEEPLGTAYLVLGTSSDKLAFLETAARIGRRLCGGALWYEDRCNWISAMPGENSGNNGQASLSYATLSSRLYDGTAGIALFLAELFAQTGEAEARHAALGAMRNAVATAEAITPAERLGLHTGWPGVALAAARVGVLLDSGEMVEGAGRLIAHLEHEYQDNHGSANPAEYPFDILTGSAGAIAALIVLSDLLERPGLLDLAAQLGDDLVLSAEFGRGGCSWRAMGAHARAYRHNLTGVSHGAGGIGYALLELSAVTGERKYQEVAEAAFEYEQACFRPSEGNWPDFRREQNGNVRGGRPRCSVAWCHGAPGIALTRLRALRWLDRAAVAEQASVALDTTAARLRAMPVQDLTNFCLCHGACGNAEILLAGDQLQGERAAAWKHAAYGVARDGIAAHAAHHGRWPCGLGPDESPSFMLGTAGIGYFYLRLSNPSIPSMLLLQREQFRPALAR